MTGGFGDKSVTTESIYGKYGKKISKMISKVQKLSKQLNRNVAKIGNYPTN